MTSPELARAAAESAPPPSGLATSFVRTFVPILAGIFLSIAARVGLDVDAEQLNGLLEPLLAGGYYLLFRTLEAKVDPRFGWFLGKAATPMYADAKTLEGEALSSQYEQATAIGNGPLSEFEFGSMSVVSAPETPPVVVHVHNYGPGGSIDVEGQRVERKPDTDV